MRPPIASFPTRSSFATVVFLAALSGCGGGTSPEASRKSVAPAITNRIPLPADVVANLGITFEKAKRGRLETRLRIPGRVEVAPEARFVVRAPSSGRIALGAARWQHVVKGEVLGELVSPDLRRIQEELAEAAASVDRLDLELVLLKAGSGPLAEIAQATEAALASSRERAKTAQANLESAEGLATLARERVESTQKLTAESGLASGVVFTARKDHVEAQAAALEATVRRDEARSAIPELTLRLATARARAETAALEIGILERKRATAETSVRQQLRHLAVLTGFSVEDLTTRSAAGPAWALLESIAIRSPADGLVTEVVVSDAEWVESAASLLRIVDARKMMFRGEVPESDAARIPADASVRIEVGCADCSRVDAKLGSSRPVADPRTRTILVEARLPGDGSAYPDGSSASAAVLIGRSENEETLIPAACVVQDELETLVFRRDPAQPAQVIRLPISIGRRSEGWVEVLSGVAEGDEVVRDGVHQLRLTGIGKASANGHFHADGSWHEGKED